MGLFLVSYLAAPLVLLAASAGAGLLVRRLARGAIAPVLVLPAGFVTLLAVGTFLTGFAWSFTAHLNWVAIVLLGVGGLVWCRRDIRPLLGERVELAVARPRGARRVPGDAVARVPHRPGDVDGLRPHRRSRPAVRVGDVAHDPRS